MTLAAIVLAAGKGTRMKSSLPKVLHRLAGAPLVQYPVRAAAAAGATQIVVVVGHGAEQVRSAVHAGAPDDAVVGFAVQDRQLGTGHAVSCALPELVDVDGPVLILSGDVPMLRAQTLRDLVAAWRNSSAGLSLAVFVPEQTLGYGRIIRDGAQRIVAIREERDADEAERAITECNAGTYCVDAQLLRDGLRRLGQANAQGEIYLTDLVQLAAQRGEVIALTIDPIEAAGVNTPDQLAELERVFQSMRSSP